jgi:6-phosphogluconolactonase (cycloisomerase 2 family)
MKRARREGMGMKKDWNRREFVQLMGYSALGSAAVGSSLLSTGARSSVRFAYVASERDAIRVYAVRGAEWTHVQTIASERPVSLAVGQGAKALYAVNEVSVHNGLPMGTVESFAIGKDGGLTKLNRQALSLSATMPRHAAVAPDGKSLVVAVREGGAYNVLPIGEDGSLGRVSSLLKETGVERAGVGSVARPHTVAFDTAGRVIAGDAGTGRVSVLGLSGDGLRIHTRLESEDGVAVSRVAMHPGGKALYAMREDGIACYGYDPGTGKFGEKRHHAKVVCDGDAALAVHRSGEFVYASRREGGVAVWTADRSTGRLSAAGVDGEAMGELRAMEMAPEGNSLIAVNNNGRVMESFIDAASGRLSAAALRARVESPRCVALV